MRKLVLLWCLASSSSHPVEEIIGTWSSPPHNVPSKGVPDGPLIGNGRLGGVLGWHSESEHPSVDLHLGHNGFFAAPSGGASSCGYSAGGRKALAGLTLEFPGLAGAQMMAQQLAANGTALIMLKVGSARALTLSAFIHATEDVLVVELHGGLSTEVLVTLWTFSGCHGPPRPPVSPSTRVAQGGAPVSKTTGATSDRLPSQVLAGEKELRVARGNGWPFQATYFPVRWFGLSATLGGDPGSSSFTDVEAMGRCGPELFLRGPCAKGTWRPKEGDGWLAVRLGRWPLMEKPQFSSLMPLAELRATHWASWTNFWERSFICIHDSAVTMFHWYMSQYLLRISSWHGPAPGLFGPFVVDDEVVWSGDITLNYNAEAVYYNAGAANHLEAFEPYFQAILDFIPAARRMAAELYPNCPDSLAFPAHLLPEGVQVPGVGRGDLGQKQMGLFAAVPFILYWRYTGSLAFAERALPFLNGVARFWECNLVAGEDAYLHDAEDCAEEICLPDGDVQPDPTVVLSLLPGFFQTLAEMTELLDPERARHGDAGAPASASALQQLARRVAPYATEEVDGAQVVADFYGGESAHGRELRLHAGGSVAWGGLFAAFPLGTVHRRSRKEEIELVHRSLVRFFKQWPGGKQGNSFPHAFAAAARVGWFDGLLEVWESYLTNTSDPKCRLYSNGMVLGCGGTGLENVGGAAFASEMLLSTAGGVLEVFPAPLDTVAAFRLRAPGPLLVTAQMAPGHHVTEIELELPTPSEEPSVVRTDWLVQSPWPGQDVLVNGQVTNVGADGLFRVFLTDREVVRITGGKKGYWSPTCPETVLYIVMVAQQGYNKKVKNSAGAALGRHRCDDGYDWAGWVLEHRLKWQVTSA
ncbi:WW domain-containing oxidoreductase [Durusdinium trenchii]|uniref:WW domain-containing oxidoreductase n=1 Tax=Durusdinium trenchii TaxID=1381693 RepID=A0ABP0SNL1_9DINO